jgi:NitT/TauT family transport system substrate-binding protein
MSQAAGLCRRLVAALLAALGAASVACAADAPVEVAIGVVPAVPAAITFLAVDKGYLRDVGIEAKIEFLDTVSKAIPFIAGNHMQVVQGGGLSVGYFNALVQGLPISMALDTGSSPVYHDILVRPDLKDEIREIKDLKGRNAALVGPGSVAIYELGKLLEDAGMTLKDVEIKFMPFTQMGAGLANKGVDVAMTVPPFGDLNIDKGLGVRWIDPDKLIKPTPMMIASYMYNTDWAAQNPDVARRLFVALARAGREYCQAYHHGPNRAELVDALIAHKAMSDRALADRMDWPARDPNGRFNLASIVDVQDWFFEHGLLKEKAPVERLVDPRYADAAAKQLGSFELINKASPLAGCR